MVQEPCSSFHFSVIYIFQTQSEKYASPETRCLQGQFHIYRLDPYRRTRLLLRQYKFGGEKKMNAILLLRISAYPDALLTLPLPGQFADRCRLPKFHGMLEFSFYRTALIFSFSFLQSVIWLTFKNRKNVSFLYPGEKAKNSLAAKSVEQR